MRPDDLDRIADLGIKTLRYPALWEHISPNHPDERDWSWLDERLPRLRELGIRPIAGLVHHGSGPSYTSLLDDSFATGLADHARAVAERFPWIDAYTPVNEPLTTARFSALYGIWYHHARDDYSFVRCLLNQCKATILAMREIRRVNPQAQLIQTEDLGKIYATRKLRYQSDFENERRWLTWDILCGRIDRSHRLWWYFRKFGGSEAELLWFKENACPPDVIGVNYYVTSERFLDEDVSQYPPNLVGSNGKHVYVDVEAVRVRRPGIAGAGAMLTEAWQRYRLPLAITEAHLGCTREEQQRWLLDVWRSAESARASGADVRAVTAWSLFGAYNWNCLLSRDDGCYEPGAFDLRAPTPRETGLARVARSLAQGEAPSNPALEQPGWWRRDIRFEYMPRGTGGNDLPIKETQPILITGGNGMLAQAFARHCRVRGLACKLLTRKELDITNPTGVCEVLSELRPWAVLNAAGFSDVEAAENQIERCMADNAKGPAILAEVCQEQACRLVTFSCDQVFDGEKQTPYTEEDRPNPLNIYGRSKAVAERVTLVRMPTALVIRTAALFDLERGSLIEALRQLQNGHRVEADGSQVISPTYVPHLVNATLDLLIDEEEGIWHLTNEGTSTWLDLLKECAREYDLDPERVQERKGNTRRPDFSALTSSRAWIMPTLEEALSEFTKRARETSRTRAYVS